MTSQAAIARFERHVDRSAGPDACHPWTAGLDGDGYGLFWIGHKCIGAHRFALSLKLGRPLALGEVTRHAATCFMRACCNDSHLTPGTIADNNRDMADAGRQARGETHGHVRLSVDEVAAILSMPSRRAKELAAEYGVTDRQIYHLRSGKRWRHLPRPVAIPATPSPEVRQ